MNPGDLDPGCHRAALAVASAEPGFEWNVSGMDVYWQNYNTCTDADELYGG